MNNTSLDTKVTTDTSSSHILLQRQYMLMNYGHISLQQSSNHKWRRYAMFRGNMEEMSRSDVVTHGRSHTRTNARTAWLTHSDACICWKRCQP